MIIAPASHQDPWLELFLSFLKLGNELVIASWFPFRAQDRPHPFWVLTEDPDELGYQLVPGEELEDDLLRQPTLQEFNVGWRYYRLMSAGQDEEESPALFTLGVRWN